MKINRLHGIFLGLLFLFAGGQTAVAQGGKKVKRNKMERAGKILEFQDITPGIARIDEYGDYVEGKRVAVVVNNASVVESGHTIDFLLKKGLSVTKIFTPEHGFRGNADRGAKVGNAIDPQTGLPIVSLYGSHRKPTMEDMEGIDMVIFDLQDVGVRFYTYISTMHYVMEACAKADIPMLIADRPNPNGFYVDGPVLNPEFKSFIGMHPIPVVHGLTVGELARMINGEGWLEEGMKAELLIVTCFGYNHKDTYTLPVKPSPNLPNLRSILLYPSLCLFEGTTVSVGRGTDMQFQVIGHPDYPDQTFSFTPKPMPGASNPVMLNKTCYGKDLSDLDVTTIWKEGKLDLSYFMDFHNTVEEDFFLENNFLDLLMGTDTFRKAVMAGEDESSIRASWANDLDEYRELRKEYVLYPDFSESNLSLKGKF